MESTGSGQGVAHGQQAVLVFIKLSQSPVDERNVQELDNDDSITDAEFPNQSEDEAIYALQEKLNHLLEQKGVGEFDGDEWGGGVCQLFMYGANADKIFDAISPVLLAQEKPAVSHAIKRYGPPGAPEQVVQLGSAVRRRKRYMY